MERLTDCAQGYCEMYCKKYMLCFEDPENCAFKNEIKLYDALKSIEGIVPLDRLLELADSDRAGRLVVLPFELHSSMMNLSDPKNPGLMNDVRLSVSWTTSGIVFNAPYDFFLQDMKRGYIKHVSKEAEAALAGKDGSE